MTPFETALARSRTYGLIAEVLLEGWTPRALSVVEGLPWSASIPREEDRRAARHQRVFGRGVPPYESVFRSADGLLGGPIAGAVRAAYDRMGFRLARTDVEPDHAGLQCAALSFLCGAEADARRDGVAHDRFATLQLEFLRGHLGVWVDLLHTAVSRQGVAEMAELTGLLVDLVHEHAGPQGLPDADGPTEDLLSDPSTGLKDVAAYLLVPARCGMWLGTDDIQRVAERAGLACGFGRRVQMMESLLFSAVDHEALPALVASLGVELDAWDSGSARSESTRAMLGRLARGEG
ncbi:MAG: molecular chaperone TorD family protein [Myxococcota bacterium]